MARMFGPRQLEFLLARSADLDQPFRTFDTRLARFEVGLHRHVAGPSLGKVGTVNLRQRRTARDVRAELDRNARDTTAGERRHAHLAVGIRLHGPGDTEPLVRAAMLDRLNADSGTLYELVANLEHERTSR